MSTVTKGNYAITQARKMLEEEGYLTEKVEFRSSRIMKNPDGSTFYTGSTRDCFGCFDILAIRQDSLVRFIQVKTRDIPTNAITELEALPSSPYFTKEIWCKRTARIGRKNQWEKILIGD